MKNSEPKIISGTPQALDYIDVGIQSNSGKGFPERFLLMDKKLFENAPLHIAVHIIKEPYKPLTPYTHIHCHPTCDEIGLIVAPQDELEYEFVLNGENYRVKSPATVYIPAGTHHRDTAVSGSGVYVCILLDPQGPVTENVQIVE